MKFLQQNNRNTMSILQQHIVSAEDLLGRSIVTAKVEVEDFMQQTFEKLYHLILKDDYQNERINVNITVEKRSDGE